MRDMYQLASLMLEFKRKAESDGVAVTSHDLFNREFYRYLAAAIQTLNTRPQDKDSEKQLKAWTAAYYKDNCRSVEAKICHVRK